MKKEAIKAGILGAGGYTGGELIRILINHPKVKFIYCQSKSQQGKMISEVHGDLVGECDLFFQENLNYEDLDVIFLCKGHGESKKLMSEIDFPNHLKIIDLSQDFRLKAPGNKFVYGLPECNKEAIKKTDFLANPGCFATAIQLGILPAMAMGVINSTVNTSGITGATGAGQSLSRTSHFSWRNNNMSVYKPFTHQHLHEIKENMTTVSESDVPLKINFIPYRGNFTRGIIISSYFETDLSYESALKMYQQFYGNAPFTHVVTQNPDLKQVVNSNKALVYLEKQGDQLLVISVIDNLLKGASGQAVQNMNLMFGLSEDMGLRLKTASF